MVDADVRPPIRRGDMDRIPPDVELVAIVDGVFMAEHAVSPREVLGALRRGVRVLGASSMGALRAAELRAFGMEGVGEIARMYMNGELQSDADVALVFDPETFRALSQPVVNVIHMLRLATAAKVLGKPAANEVLAVARGMYFPELTYPALIRRLRDVMPAFAVDRLAAFILTHEVEGDLKHADAVAAIRRVNELCAYARAGGLRD
jgi:TfuA protein